MVCWQTEKHCPWYHWRVATTQGRFGAELVKSSGGGMAINLDQTDIVDTRLREGRAGRAFY